MSYNVTLNFFFKPYLNSFTLACFLTSSKLDNLSQLPLIKNKNN